MTTAKNAWASSSTVPSKMYVLTWTNSPGLNMGKFWKTGIDVETVSADPVTHSL